MSAPVYSVPTEQCLLPLELRSISWQLRSSCRLAGRAGADVDVAANSEQALASLLGRLRRLHGIIGPVCSVYGPAAGCVPLPGGACYVSWLATPGTYIITLRSHILRAISIRLPTSQRPLDGLARRGGYAVTYSADRTCAPVGPMCPRAGLPALQHGVITCTEYVRSTYYMPGRGWIPSIQGDGDGRPLSCRSPPLLLLPPPSPPPIFLAASHGDKSPPRQGRVRGALITIAGQLQ